MLPENHPTERLRRPADAGMNGRSDDDHRWHRNDTSRELWEAAVLWSAAFGEPIEKAVG
jgi:hypothetical protein